MQEETHTASFSNEDQSEPPSSKIPELFPPPSHDENNVEATLQQLLEAEALKPIPVPMIPAPAPSRRSVEIPPPGHKTNFPIIFTEFGEGLAPCNMPLGQEHGEVLIIWDDRTAKLDRSTSSQKDESLTVPDLIMSKLLTLCDDTDIWCKNFLPQECQGQHFELMVNGNTFKYANNSQVPKELELLTIILKGIKAMFDELSPHQLSEK
jgi:hypothetical protein